MSLPMCQNNTRSSMPDILFNFHTIDYLIKIFKHSNVADPMGINNNILKSNVEDFSTILSNLFFKSYDKGIYLSNIKKFICNSYTQRWIKARSIEL